MVKANRLSARYEARTAEFRKRLKAKRAEKKAMAEARKGILELRNIPLDKKEGE